MRVFEKFQEPKVKNQINKKITIKKVTFVNDSIALFIIFYLFVFWSL